jgi:hypothetical protein
LSIADVRHSNERQANKSGKRMKKSLLVACKRGVLHQYTVASCDPIFTAPTADYLLRCTSPLMADFVAEVGDHGFLVTDH